MSEFEVRIVTVDAFTKCRFGGNPAAVILECQEIPEGFYQPIANEINLAQTVFVEQISPDFFKLDFYTPNAQLSYSGHATLGAFYVLADTGYIRPLENGVKSVHALMIDKTVLEIKISYEGYKVSNVAILCPKPRVNKEFKHTINKDLVRKILKIGSNSILDVVVGGCFQDDIFVLVDNKETLYSIKPDPWVLKSINFSTRTQGLFAFTDEIKGNATHSYARYFSPLYGIPEEIATATAAVYAGNMLLIKSGEKHIDIYQGQNMHRPSKVEVDNIDDQLWVSGVGRLVTDGIMKI